MSYINEIAFHLNRRDEVPNQELAARLAEADNREGIQEIASFLFDKNKSIASDCIKVLYEIGYLKPELIAEYVSVFLKLLKSKQNRMVWGGMIALSTIATLSHEEIWKERELVLETIRRGTVITLVSGIRVLVGLAASGETYKKTMLPVLFDYLENCRPIDFATRAETMLPVICTEDEKELFMRIIRVKEEELSEAQKKKLKRVLKTIN